MERERKTVRTGRGQKEYTYLGCPLTRNRTAWCYRLCTPDEEGAGRCGRVAPHGLKGRTQRSIEGFNRKQLETHWEKLERRYLAAASSEYFDPGVSVSQQEAEIVVAIRDEFFCATGIVHPSVHFALMADAAALAVNSIVEDALVVPVNFNVQFASPRATGELLARARLLGISGDHYLAESALSDSDGNEIGRASGAFMQSDVPLSPEIGYE